MPEQVFIDRIISEWGEEIMESLIENDSLYLAAFNLSGELLFANGPMKSLLGNNPTEKLINPSFEKLSCGSGNDRLIFKGILNFGDYNSINTSLQGNVYRKDEILFISGIPDTKSISQTNTAMHSLNREISNLQRSLIKEKKNLESSLLKIETLNSELELLLQDKDRFISVLAHDLKSPFGALLGLSELLASRVNESGREEIAMQANYIFISAQKIYNLLEDILIWARSHSGKLPLKPERLAVTDYFDYVISIMGPAAAAKNISLINAIETDTFIESDIEMTRTVLRNLVSNAIKFTSAGGQIHIGARYYDGGTMVWVKDTGKGMSEAEIKLVLDKSSSFSTEGTMKEKGTGLGLSLCIGFIERHGGKLHIESTPGAGSTISFTIPLT